MAEPKKFKAASLYDSKRHQEVFAIKVLVKGEWKYAGDNSGPFFFDKEEKRDQKLKELKSLA